MNERTSGPIDDELLAAFVEGELAPIERATIGAALAEDPRLKRRADELEHVRHTLSAPVRELDGIDLTDAVRARVGAQERSLSRRGVFLAGASVVAAAAALTIVVTRAGTDSAKEFRAKSSTSALASVQRWTGIQAHRARDGAPELVTQQFARSDGLLFSYTNRGEAPFAYLMIFGVDRAGGVYWFHPAYERIGENPRSITIRAGAVEELLPEVVRHDFDSGPLSVHALFTRRPLGVLEVEAWVARRRTNTREPPPADGHVQVLELDVKP